MTTEDIILALRSVIRDCDTYHTDEQGIAINVAIRMMESDHPAHVLDFEIGKIVREWHEQERAAGR